MNNGSAVPGVSSTFQGILKNCRLFFLLVNIFFKEGNEFQAFSVLEYSCLHFLISILLKLHLSIFIELKKPGDKNSCTRNFVSLIHFQNLFLGMQYLLLCISDSLLELLPVPLSFLTN